MSTRWIYALLVFLYACGGNNNTASENKEDLGIKSARQKLDESLAMIAEAKPMIKDGDLLLRTGNDFSSSQVRLFSKEDQTYSHGGIAFHEGGEIYVYHVVPDYHHITDKVRKEKLDSFCNPVNNLGFGIARYKLDSLEINTFHKYLDKQYQDKIPFDKTFDLSTDDSLYCSEMIRKGLILATKNRITLRTDKLLDRSKYKMISQYFKVKEKVFAGREFIPIDHLFVHPECEVIKRFAYEQ